MGRARSAATMQDVEMVDVAGTSSAPGSRTGPPRRTQPDPDTAGRRRRRWLAVGVAVAVALGVSEVVGRVTAVEPAVEVPAGMVAPVDGPPWARWRAPAARTDDVLAASGALVVSAVRDRRFEVVAHDEGTGERLWARDLGPVSGTQPLTGCPHDGGDVGDLLLCVVEPPLDPRETWRRGTVAFPAPDDRWARVSAVLAATGEVVGTWRVQGRLVGVQRVGDDLVVLSVGADGRARVSRYDGLTGDRLWWYRGSAPLRLREGIVSGAELRVSDEFVLVQGWAATVLDVDDGTELTSTPPATYALGSLGGSVFGTWTNGVGATVRDAEGRELFTARALFPVLAASDGEPRDVLVLDEGGALVGRSVADGRELWRLDTYRAARLRAGGHLLLLGVDGYQVADVRTGEVTWESPVRALMWWAPLTDGRTVLAPGRSGGGAPTLEARRLDDGHLEWSMPLEEGVRSVTAVGGHLVLRTRHELVVLG